ncbi:MAG: sigma-54-dependent Fis family transcriptional regulator [Acidobacteria bacterium]|nr:MAG: sigma-54-dependent Fis family transcriptional regulator [Acidobacteriota bacterium]
MIRLVLFSGDPKLQRLLAPALGSDYSVLVESDPSKLEQFVAAGHVDVLILDADSNYSSVQEQVAFFDEIRDSRVPVVVMTNDSRRATVLELLQRGVYDYLRKPPSLPELKIVVRRAHEHASLQRELEKAREKLRATSRCDRLIGASARSQVVYDLIRRVANLDAFVLITGESGTGKELVARAIHNLSKRVKEPFVAVSCGAIPETLIEAELFGHEKGAFTGTNGTREGYMEQAGEGTLLLDEIGELSLQTQVKLLRVLQQREFSRLGSNRLIPLKARVLFATHRNLASMVEQGTFRRDLYYRVNVMRISVPPLRDRTDDIPLLADHFLQQYASAYNKPVREIRPNAMALLFEYDWPGNIRELENAIQGAVILSEGDSIGPEDLPEPLQHVDLMDDSDSPVPGSFEDQLREYKIRLANKAIRECNGNKTLAARSLSISRAYLHRLVRIPAVDEIDAA